MHGFLSGLVHQVYYASPLFLIILIGYSLVRWAGWRKSISDGLNSYVFQLAVPAMLFVMLADLSKLPPVDARLLIAFFGATFVVFAIGRLIAAFVFHLDGTAASIFAIGGVFSNNVMLGLPIAKLILGEAAVPSVALVLVFNALILWSLVTMSVEWAQHGSFSVKGVGRTVYSVSKNPLILAIISGALFGLTGWSLPHVIYSPLNLISQTAPATSLLVLGMGLAEYSIRDGWQKSLVLCGLKLIILPLIAWGLCALLALPIMETQVVVLLSSISMGANVYLMSRHFAVMEGVIAAALVLSTAVSVLTTPLILALVGIRLGG